MKAREKALRVLVVDDEEGIANSVAAILAQHHCEVRTAYDAKRAIRLAEEFRPEALVSDVSLPGMGGIDLAVFVRQKLPACKVLLISGLVESFGELERAMRQGYVFNVLPKPLMPNQLLAFVASCGGWG